MGDIPRVSDPQKYPERMRSFTEIVGLILNSLLDNGQIVRGLNNTYIITGVTGSLTPGTFTNTTIVVDADGVITSVTTGSGGDGDPISSIYPVFAVTGDSDEFDGVSFTGWTDVNSGAHLPTITQQNNILSILHPGGDASGEIHAWVKAPTITAGSYVECGFRSCGFAQNFTQAGLVFADGNSYGAGVQATFFESQNDRVLALSAYTNYSTQGSTTTMNYQYGGGRTDTFLRLVYNGANSFTGFVSCDGIGWVPAITKSVTLTPTFAGFFVSTFGGASPYLFSYRYCKFG